MAATTSDSAPTSPPILISPEYTKSEIRIHWIFFSMAAAILLASFAMSSSGETKVYLPGFNTPMPQMCTSRRLFNLDCPGCGLTRSFISISHGEFARAWEFNRASYVVYLFTAIQLPWHAFQIWRLRTNRYPIVWTWIYFIPLGVVFALVVNWIWKLCS